MNAPSRRKPPPLEPLPSQRPVAEFLSARRAGLGAIAVVVLAIGASALLWSRVAERVHWSGGYQLLPAMVEVRGVGPWVKADLRSEALRAASLDRALPLADPDLPNRLARAFDMHPWVKQVVRVELKHPAGAVVEVVCRDPVAMVGVKGGLMAVDAEGVVLPSADFTAELAAGYPRVSGVESSPQGPEGSRWGDPLVEEGAVLAQVIAPEWRALDLVECRPVVERGVRMWELVGSGGRLILFGSAPGREAAGELSAAAKIARLKELVAAAETSTDRIDLTGLGSALPAATQGSLPPAPPRPASPGAAPPEPLAIPQR